MSGDSAWSEILETRSEYQLAGLHILSDYSLPGLAAWKPHFSAQGEINITRSQVPQLLPEARAKFPEGQCSEAEFLLHVPEAGRFLMRAGREILVEQAPSATDDDVRPFLLGSALGVLFHQRGMVPLHAATIQVEGGCVALVGGSGAGKSTLAGALAERGFEIISDDVCYLHIGENGNVSAWPGVRRLRLWEDAMLALSLNGPDVVRELSGYNKFLVPLPQLSDPVRPRRLLKVFRLEDAAEGISEIRGADALQSLLQNIYRLEYAEYMGLKPAVFQFCAQMARQVGVFRFARPMSFDRLQSGIDLLTDHLRRSGL